MSEARGDELVPMSSASRRRLQETIFIKADPALVFKIHDDPAESERWVPNLISVEVLGDGVKKPGSRVRVKLKVFGLFPSTFVQDVVTYDPPKSIRMRGSGPGMSFEEEYAVQAEADGARVSYDVYLTYRGLMKLFAPLTDRLNRHMMKKELSNIKRAAENYPKELLESYPKALPEKDKKPSDAGVEGGSATDQ